MGFFKDISRIKKQAKELSKTFDPGAQMRQTNAMLADAGKMMEQQTVAARMAVSGEPATAQVVAAGDTGEFINMQPVLELSLLIFHADRPPYPVTLRQIVPVAQMARLAPGTTLQVKVDPNLSNTVWIDWGAT
jgi:hypothetical protein